ncbi:hypothetical protein A6A26_02400 [Pantoea sp. OXWO6B1]|nr:hypothetical protein A6A26_02400 [Pantoea sp. OXWO6B1]
MFECRFLFFGAWHAETLVEAVNAATSGNFTLLTSVERVALTTNVQVQFVSQRRASVNHVAASTVDGNCFVFWVNTLFHGKPHIRPCRSPRQDLNLRSTTRD